MSLLWRFCSDRKSTRLNSSHTVIYTLSLHDALPICRPGRGDVVGTVLRQTLQAGAVGIAEVDVVVMAVLLRSEEHTSELQSHSDLHSFPTRRSSDLPTRPG